MKLFGKIALGLALGLLTLAPGAASAAPITGFIGFGGEWAPSGGPIETATGVNVVDEQALVVGRSGSFAGISLGTVATYNDFTFNPLGGNVNPLWSVGGFSFVLSSVAVDEQDTNSLVLIGSGTVSGNGYDPTLMAFSFSGDTAGGTFTFSSNVNPNVPEPAALGLMGFALMAGATALRRRKQTQN